MAMNRDLADYAMHFIAGTLRTTWDIHMNGANAPASTSAAPAAPSSPQEALNSKAPKAPKSKTKPAPAAPVSTATPQPKPADDFGSDEDLFTSFDQEAAPAAGKSDEFGDFGAEEGEGFAGDAADFGADAGAAPDDGFGSGSEDADAELPDGPDEEGLYVVAAGTVGHFLDCSKGDWRIKGSRKVKEKDGKILSWSTSYATPLNDEKGKPLSGFCVLLDESEAPASEGQIDKGFWVVPTTAVRAHLR